MINRQFFSGILVSVIAITTSLLYLPYLNNALVFDDHGFFSTLDVYEHAQRIFNFQPRTFPYFTLGFIQVESGRMEVHRTISLVLHILCAGLLFTVSKELASCAFSKTPADASSEKQVAMFAFIGALWFAIHPVAVYGAAYLIQRTILFATLFSLLSIWFYCRAFAKNRTIDVVTAALFYSLAVFSKEHAVMLMFAVAPLAILYSDDLRLNIKRAGLYFLLCTPAALIAAIQAKSIIASTYEPHAGVLLDQIHGIPMLAHKTGAWFVSMVLQAGFFLDYLIYWLFPDVRSISIDMRIDFEQVWHAWWCIPKACLFLIVPLAGFYLIRQRGRAALFGCGLFYAWVLFLTELASVRFQEPFVLYRSYLWAPGYIFMLISLCSLVRLRWIATASIPVLAGCAWLGQDRLTSLSSENTAWTDAAVKLKSKTVIGAGRILHMRGLQYMKEKKFEEAIVDFTNAIPHYPEVPQNYYQRGIAYFSLNELDKAKADFDHALSLNKNDGAVYYAQGMLLERFGCVKEAQSTYAISLKLGFKIASMKLHDLEKAALVTSPSEIRSSSSCLTSVGQTAS